MFAWTSYPFCGVYVGRGFCAFKGGPACRGVVWLAKGMHEQGLLCLLDLFGDFWDPLWWRVLALAFTLAFAFGGLFV